jgi:hypothetical protein
VQLGFLAWGTLQKPTVSGKCFTVVGILPTLLSFMLNTIITFTLIMLWKIIFVEPSTSGRSTDSWKITQG